MKKVMMAMAAASMLLSCGNESDDLAKVNAEIIIPNDTIKNHVTVTFSMCDGFTMRPMTRASLEELNLTDLWVFDYIDGDIQNTVHQSSTDETFGAPTLSMAYGSHTLYFVTSRGADPSVSGQVITWSSVRDTFWASLSLDVEPMTDTSQSVTDAVPTGAAKLNVKPSQWYLALDYTTGEPSSPSSPSLGVSIPSSYIGTTSLNASFYTISTAAMWQTDVAVSITSANDAVLGSVSLPDVPFQRNHITNYSGGILGTPRTVSVICDDDDWVDDDPFVW